MVSALLLAGAGVVLAGCADEYAAYPGYGRGYYASYSGYSPYYYGYGYAPYRSYGPYYGSPYYYGGPYYGTGAVVVARSRSYTYNDRYRHWQNRRRTSENRGVTRRAQRTPRVQYQNDEESRYYNQR